MDAVLQLIPTSLPETNILSLSKYAGPSGGYALLLDASTTLKVVGKLRVLLPEGSVGYISGRK